MTSPTENDRGLARDIEQDVEELGDPDLSPGIPSASIAAQAGRAPRPEALAPERHDAYDEIWRLAWPVIASQVLAYLVNLIDIAMVGRLGRDALAAVGYVTQVFFLVQSVFFAVSFACVALMARALGARDPARARAALAACLLVTLALALAISAVALAAPEIVLGWMNARPELVALGVPYFRLVVGSSLLLGVAITVEGGLRAARNTRTPMLIGLATTGVKIAGNGFLIFGLGGFPRLELLGAGIATVASQLVAVTLFVAVSRRGAAREVLAIGSRDLARARALLGQVLRLALPAVGERVIMNLAMISYFTIVGGYGSAALAAYTVGVRVLAFSWIPGTGFSTAASTLVGQYLGAGRPDDAARLGWRSNRGAMIVMSAAGLAIVLLARPLAGLFGAAGRLTVDLTVTFIYVLGAVQPLMAMEFALGGALRGAGDTRFPLVAILTGLFVFRLGTAHALQALWTPSVVHVYLCLVADYAVKALMLAWRFSSGRWRATRV
jgi:putative MATE family efflux protein